MTYIVAINLYIPINSQINSRISFEHDKNLTYKNKQPITQENYWQFWLIYVIRKWNDWYKYGKDRKPILFADGMIICIENLKYYQKMRSF